MDGASQIKSGIQAYNNVVKSLARPAGADGVEDKVKIGGESSVGGFEDFLSNALSGAVKQIKGAEKTSMAAINKQASPIDLVSSITQAELTLQTIISVRDKVVNAYQEIFKMPI